MGRGELQPPLPGAGLDPDMASKAPEILFQLNVPVLTRVAGGAHTWSHLLRHRMFDKLQSDTEPQFNNLKI